MESVCLFVRLFRENYGRYGVGHDMHFCSHQLDLKQDKWESLSDHYFKYLSKYPKQYETPRVPLCGDFPLTIDSSLDVKRVVSCVHVLGSRPRPPFRVVVEVLCRMIEDLDLVDRLLSVARCY